MVIKEYGDSSLPKVILLHPMLADGKCMLQIAESMEGKYCFIAPDLSGQGEDTGEYENAQKEKQELTGYLKEKGYGTIELIMGASLGAVVGMYMLTDKEIQYKTAVFEGVPLYENARLIYKIMKMGFLKKHRKALKMPVEDVKRKMTKMYGIFGECMGENFVRMSEKSIVAILKECSDFAFPPLSQSIQKRIFIEVGSKDINCRQNKTILKHYPDVHIKVREGYGHCMYLTDHYAEYGRLLEQYMRS